jgi:hypothetical protein
LAQLQGRPLPSNRRDFKEGWNPVLGTGLADLDELADWLAERIREIGVLMSDGVMPSIALLVDDEGKLDDLAAALNPRLEEMNLRAVACPADS